MSNEVTTPKQTGLGALGALKTGLANVRAAVPEVGGKPILRMLQEKDGWVFGQEDNALPLGTEIVFNTLAIKHGYVCWTDRDVKTEGKNELLDERMWGITQVATPIHEMSVLNDPKTGRVCQWKQCFSADAKVLSGKHKGTEIVYKPSSLGGSQAMGALMDAIMAKFDTYPDGYTGTMYVLPIAELRQKDPYPNKSGGKTYPPHFEIVGWMSLEGEEEDSDDGAETEAPKAVDQTAPSFGGARTADDEAHAARVAERAQPEQTEEAPRRRRRA